MRIVTRKGYNLYGASRDHVQAMEKAGLRVAGNAEFRPTNAIDHRS